MKDSFTTASFGLRTYVWIGWALERLKATLASDVESVWAIRGRGGPRMLALIALTISDKLSEDGPRMLGSRCLARRCPDRQIEEIALQIGCK